jgi:hypothetical protein
VGQTAAVVLALLGDGHTPGQGRFGGACSGGLRWLMAQQGSDGRVGTAAEINHALATVALVEAYGMTREPAYGRAAQRAAGSILGSGGRFRPSGDEATMAFQMTALRLGELVGLDVPSTAARALRTALAAPDTSPGVLARADDLPPYAVTGPLLSSLYLTGKGTAADAADEDALRSVVSRLVNYRPEWRSGDTFYWYCGTDVMHQFGGTAWRLWNESLKQTLVEHQSLKGSGMGSWDPKGGLCRRAGRVFSTALSALALESYYRYLPPEG